MADYIEGIRVAAYGLGTTLTVTAGALIIGLVIGLLIALGKMSKFKILRWPASVYVEIVRGTPLFVQILILAYGLPYLIKDITNGAVTFNWSPIVIAGVIACGLNSGAYLAEIIRSGIQAVNKGQTEAARSLGMSHIQNMRYIILPQAFKVILPAMANEFVTLIKETSILSYIGIVEITREGILWASRAFKFFPAYIGVAVVYLCLTIPLSRVVAYLEKRMSNSNAIPKHKKRKAGI
ncbi:MAG: amino acid ABC transporter permease [Firmicutes bacterium]|nr:amino acid ABC transporter permease [Bacillota bacterium]